MIGDLSARGVGVLLAVAAAVLAGYLALGVEHREVYGGSITNTALLYAHIAGGSAMAVMGPFLLSKRSRGGRLRSAHRWLGRAYLVGVLFAGGGGLYVARLVEYGGPLSRLAFACASLLWLMSGYLAYRRVREKEFCAHRRWMIRNYAITASFLTHGPWVALLTGAFPRLGLDAETGKTAADWAAFSTNLLLAELSICGSPLGRLRSRAVALARKPSFGEESLGEGEAR